MIISWNQLSEAQRPAVLNSIREIFFISSARRTFASADEREKFWHDWTDYYFSREPDLVFVALLNDRIVGYLMGCRDSARAEPELAEKIPSTKIFSYLFAEFPAHFHINFSPEARGQGLGSRLLGHFIGQLKAQGPCAGVHLVTSAEARNVGFYRRNGFDFEVIRPWKKAELLFMGLKLK